MFKSGKSHPGYVIKRWKTIKMHFWSFRTWARFSIVDIIRNIFLDNAIYIKTSYLCLAIFQS